MQLQFTPLYSMLLGSSQGPQLIRIKPSANTPLEAMECLWTQVSDALCNCQEVIFIFENKHSSAARYVVVPQFSLCGSIKPSLVIRVMKILLRLLRLGTSTTVRDIYYQDVNLFNKEQRIARKMIHTFATSLGVSPEEGLCVYPGQKGMAYGEIIIQLPPSKKEPTQRLIDIKEPGLIPILTHEPLCEYRLVCGNPKAIVVLEKEAVFRSLSSSLQKSKDHDMIVVTGKGFPCKLTRRFISLLELMIPGIPVLVFVDADIYGIEICATYRYNSTTETGRLLDCGDFQPRNLQYMGPYLSEYQSGFLDIDTKEWLRMQRFLINHSAGSLHQKSELEVAFHREITRGMYLLKKCEMNSISEPYQTFIVRKVRRFLERHMKAKSMRHSADEGGRCNYMLK
jgi:meiotic recombination protein SPO11